MRWFKSNKKKNDRERFVNVIYFIDASQTRSIKISVAKFKLALVAIVFWMLWFLLSTFLNMNLWQQKLALESRLRSSLATIFRYEIQYDGIYNYATGEDVNPIAIVPPEVKESITLESSQEESLKVAAQDQKDEEEAGNSAEDSDSKDDAIDEGKALATIAKPVVEVGRDKLDLRFDLISSVTSGKARGYVYGIAEFKRDSGEKNMIVAPEAVTLGSNGEGVFLKKAISFAIRRFKQQTLRFSFDPKTEGYFTNVQIHVLNPDTSARNTYNLPIKIRIGQSPSAPEKQAKTSG